MAPQAAFRAFAPVRNLKSMALVARPAYGAAPAAPVPGLGNVDFGIVDVGSRSGPVLLTATGWGFSTSTPFLVLAHPRQNQFDDNQNNGFPDQFATQVVSTDFDSITILITRIDPGAEGNGWGQDLELDIFVIE
ncbi:MAG TPA: hypothetical protein VF043_33230 [Ktedonobacteraceae bacterium]